MNKEDYLALSQELDVEPALLKAVHVVECGGGDGFLPSGRPKILFEAHQFYKYLKQKRGADFASDISGKYTNICWPNWDRKKYFGGEREWERLELARSIDYDVANLATSWGLGQIMGFNYALAGCSSIDEFVQRNMFSTAEQMFMFGIFLQQSGLLHKLRRKDWAGFAKGYNGSSYAQNSYDIKLKQAYEKAVNQGYNS